MVNAPRTLGVSLLAALLLTSGVQAQGRGARASRDVGGAMQLMAQAAQLERDGQLAEAGATYRQVLDEEPARLTALLGLERVWRQIDRLDSVRAYIAAAVQNAPANENIRELEFRVVAELDGAPGAERVAVRWIAANPESAEPYRVWSFWLARGGDLARAKQVIAQGAERVGEARLAPYAAQLLLASGDWLSAARQWRLAVEANEGYSPSAAASLRQAPDAMRQTVLGLLLNGPGVSPPARRLAADLLLYWSRPDEAWAMLDAALPDDPPLASATLRRFAERARELRTPPGYRARGYALERLADYTTGREQSRARLEAAQAFADAGELASARRILERVPGDRAAPSDDASAMATLIGVLAESGRADEAEQYFADWRDRLPRDVVGALRQRLAWARLLRGDFARAAALLGQDSTIGGEAIRGWLAVYRGELASAREHFRAAGPAAASRDEATRRTGLLVLLERLPAERDETLGNALLTLARGDTLGALDRLNEAAEHYRPGDGRADVLAFGGAVALDAGRHELALPLFERALAADSTGPAAPSSLLGLARVYVALGKPSDATQQLEQLILGYPESAVVPQARRLLDQVRGMIPKS